MQVMVKRAPGRSKKPDRKKRTSGVGGQQSRSLRQVSPLTVKTFEKRLAQAAKAQFGTAEDGGDQGLADEILNRLADPSRALLAEPGGPWVYEDPLLDSAWAHGASGFGAAADGDDLDSKFYHWFSFVAPFVRGKLARNWDTLKDLRPGHDVTISGPRVRLAVFGDGGYRGLAQQTVFRLIERQHEAAPFQAILHLGDTYHGGSDSEMFNHLVVPLAELRNRLTAPPLAFSLCGNHDIYSGPDGYRGLVAALNQPGRYFAIETTAWRIACLDSSMPAAGALRFEGQLDPEQLSWLVEKQKNDPKSLVVFTHHMPRSAWEDPCEKLLRQVRALPGLVAWYWGHEHRAAAYDARKGAKFASGCIGNGVFLEKYSDPPPKAEDHPSWFATGRCRCFGEGGTRYWPHGFLELELGEDSACETWHVEGQSPHARRIPVAKRAARRSRG
jgi:hypothetical protein